MSLNNPAYFNNSKQQIHKLKIIPGLDKDNKFSNKCLIFYLIFK